jgi:sugar lactone lactonase YvrE
LIEVGAGPEDIARGPDGYIYAGLADGRIVRVLPVPGAPVEHFASTGGRPLGLEFAADGHLIVADCRRGLLSIDSLGQVNLLTDRTSASRIRFANNLDIGRDGSIYFTDSSTRGDALNKDIWEGRPTGRLLRFDLRTRTTDVLLDHLHFANGVAVSRDGSFVLICETLAYRVRRYWLKGPKAGASDVFLDGLPGFPDNLSCDQSGIFWIALVAPRDPRLDMLAPYPVVRRIAYSIFSRVGFPSAGRSRGRLLGVNQEGDILFDCFDDSGGVYATTSAKRFGDQLMVGSLEMDALAIFPLRPEHDRAEAREASLEV